MLISVMIEIGKCYLNKKIYFIHGLIRKLLSVLRLTYL